MKFAEAHIATNLYDETIDLRVISYAEGFAFTICHPANGYHTHEYEMLHEALNDFTNEVEYYEGFSDAEFLKATI